MLSISRFVMGTAVVASTLIGAAHLNVVHAADENPVVATLNGEEIRRDEVMENVRLLPAEMQGLPTQILEGILINAVIDRKLLAKAAAAAGLADDPEIKLTMARIQEQVMQRAQLDNVVEAALTDAAITEAYAKMVKSHEGREEVHARHILLETEEAAKAVIAELDDGGDFVELAKAKSTGPSGPDGGDLGFFAPGQMVAEFDAVVFTLDTGDYTKTPVKTQFGWHVIKAEAKRPTTVPTLDASRAQLEEQISQSAASTYIEGLREHAKIDVMVKVPSKDE